MNAEVSIEAQIYELLLKSGPLSVDVLALIIGSTVDEIAEILESMAEKGYVIKLDKKKYVAIPKLTEILKHVKTLKKQLRTVGENLRDSIGNIEARMDKSYSKIADVLLEKLNNIVRTVDSMLEEITKVYKEAISKNLEAMRLITNAMIGVADKLRSSVESLRGSQKKISTDIKNLEGQLTRATMQRIQDMMSVTKGELEELSRSSVEAISSSYEEFAKSLDSLQQAFIVNIRKIGDATKKVIVLIGDMVSKIRNLADEVLSKISGELKAVGEAIPEELVQYLSEMMRKELTDIERVVDTYRDMVIAQIKNIASKRDEALGTLKSNITKLIQEIDSKFGELDETFRQNIQKQLDDLFSRAAARISESKEALERSLRNTETVMRNTLESIRNTMLSNMDKIKDSIGIGMAEIFSARLRELKRGVDSLSGIPMDLEASIRDITSSMDIQIETVSRRLSDDVDKFLSQLGGRLEETQKILSERIQVAAQKISSAETLEPMEEIVAKTIDSVMEKLNSILISLFDDLIEDIQNLLESGLSAAEKYILEKQTSSSTRSRARRKAQLEKNLSESINMVKNQLFGRLDTHKQKILGTLKEQLAIYGSGMSRILLDNAKSLVEQLKRIIIAEIGEAESAIRDEITWLNSEANSRIKLLLDRISRSLGDIRNLINQKLQSVSSNIEKSIKEQAEIMSKSISEFEAGMNEYKKKQKKVIEEMEEEFRRAFEENFASIKSTIDTAIGRMEDIFRSLEESSVTRKSTILKIVEDEMEGIRTKLRAEIATRIDGTIDEINHFSETIENVVRESFKNIDEGCISLKNSLQELVESVKKAASDRVAARIASMVDRIGASIESEKTRMIDVLTNTQETIQSSLLEKIRDIDKVVDEMGAEADKIRNVLRDSIERVKQPIIQSYEQSTKKILDTIESAGNTLREEISKEMQDFGSESQKILMGMNQKLESFETTLQKDIIVPHQESIGSISKSLGDLESGLRKQIETLRTPIENILREVRTILEQEKNESRKALNEIFSIVTDMINSMQEEADKIPSSFMRTIQQYVEEIKERPKGVLVSYGRKVLNTIMRLMIESAKESVIIVAPIIDKALEEILESVDIQALLEVYTKSKPEKIFGRAFVVVVPGLPDNLTIVSRDNKETLIILENKERKHIGIIVEEIPLTKLILGLIKQ